MIEEKNADKYNIQSSVFCMFQKLQKKSIALTRQASALSEKNFKAQTQLY